jgi:ribonuclease-3
MTAANDASRQNRLLALQEHLGVSWGDQKLLDRALTHSSYVNESAADPADDNQRLEFLGDAILDFVVGEWLFLRYPDAREGELTSLRADIVRTTGLAGFAREIGLGAYLRLGRGEQASGGARRGGNLCAAFEALVGALYLDQGIAKAREWICSFLESHAQRIDQQRSDKDAKSHFQEFTQARLHITPNYRIVNQVGPDHAKIFTSQVFVGDDLWGQGTGNSKQAAELAAAQAALGRALSQE